MTVTTAVTGATGCIGRALVSQLARSGGTRVLARNPSAHSEALRAAGHEVVPGDLEDPAALRALVEGVDVVYHCAAQLGNTDRRLSTRVNVQGTRALADACRDAGVRRLVYVSSISVYSATSPAAGVLHERDEPENIDRLCTYSRTKYLGELAVRDVAARGGLEFTIIRPTNVYGPWSQPWFLSWARLLRKAPIAIGDLPIDVVHVDDVATALIQAGAATAAANETLHIGHETVVMREFIARIGKVVGRRAAFLPRSADRLLRVVADRAFRAATGTTTAMPLLRASRYPHARAAAVIGYAPQVTIEHGFAALGRWFRDEYERAAGRHTGVMISASAMARGERAAATIGTADVS